MNDCSECTYSKDCWLNAGCVPSYDSATIRACCTIFVSAFKESLSTGKSFELNLRDKTIRKLGGGNEI